jgi:trans-2,3-dihydro-3-hydroxyanthranilate isomerase
MRRLSFVTIDVFTTRPLEGNQLAVFTDARELDDAEMQALARETRLSETTFVIPREPVVERERGVRVRIFTIVEELPFAGHPTLGTAAALAKARGLDEIALDLNVGRIPVRFTTDGDGLFGEMTQRDPEFGMIHEPDVVARAAGIPLADIAAFAPIQTASVGFPFAMVPMKSLDAIRSLRIDLPRATEYLQKTDARFFYFITRETVDPLAHLHARMLFYGGEDPATGSAAGPAGAWMVRYGVAAPESRIGIEQGIEMRRPSRLFVRASCSNDRVHNLRVAGYTVEVMRGEASLA